MKKGICLSIVVVFGLVLLGMGALGTKADSGSANFVYLAGSGFLCGLSPSACPDVADASNGDTIHLSGTGTLSIHPKSVSGAGTFTHKDSAGNTLATGGWTAMELLSFNDYGTSPGVPPALHGGLAIIRVHLSPSAGGPGVDAILEVDCALGKVPPGHEEGVRLAIQAADTNFNKKVSGFTVFIELP